MRSCATATSRASSTPWRRADRDHETGHRQAHALAVDQPGALERVEDGVGLHTGEAHRLGDQRQIGRTVVASELVQGTEHFQLRCVRHARTIADLLKLCPVFDPTKSMFRCFCFKC